MGARRVACAAVLAAAFAVCAHDTGPEARLARVRALSDDVCTITKALVLLRPGTEGKDPLEQWSATDTLKCRGRELETLGLKPKDALHLASAEAALCDVFLTTDDGILKKVSQFGKMKVENPVNFIMEAR